MRPEDTGYTAEWLRIAERDWARVGRLLRDGDAELAAFCLQQAVEKFLKAFLLNRGWRLRRTHDLEALLDDAVAFDARLDSFRAACQTITKYYMMERYPVGPMAAITLDEVSRNRDAADALIAMLLADINARPNVSGEGD